MAGFRNDTVYANNVDFSGATIPAPTITTDGQLLIGSTVTPNIRVGNLTSTGGTITVTNSAGNINLEAAASVPTTFDANTGSAAPVANVLNIFGSIVAAGTHPLRSIGAGNTITLQTQYSQAIVATDATKVGLANFDSAHFTVDANGFVSVNGSGLGETITGTSGGALSPTSGNWNILGASTAAGTTPVSTSGAVSTLTINIQKSQAIAATDATKIGLSNFNSAQFTVDANGFVGLKGSATNPGILGVHPNATSGGGTDPTLADASGNISILAATVAAGTNPIRSVATAVNSITVQAQISQALAASDATKIGLANFNSAQFTVDANGFVSAAGTGIPTTITGDSGGALSPSANNWNILGRSGSKTSGSGSTLTIKSPAYADAGGSATSTLNSGSFVTGAFTLTLPASAGLADGDLFEYVATSASAIVIQSVGAQKIRLGNQITSAAGTITSTAIGDAVILRFRASDGFFYATSIVGNWTPA